MKDLRLNTTMLRKEGKNFYWINVNGSCAKCNTFLHGNIIGYRKGLIERYSLADVEILEDQRHDLKKWTRSELLEIIEKYKK